MVKGSIPGSKGGWVLVRDAVKKTAPEGLPFPAALLGGAAEAPADEAPAADADAPAAEKE